MRLRVLSYNIHGGIGRDGRADPARILDVLHASDADLIALQEVQDDDAADRSFLRSLERDAEWSVHYGPTMRRKGGRYGNLVLTRLPVLAEDRADLSVPRREPRGAIRIRVQAGAGSVEAIATHLGLLPGERRRQVRRLCEWLPEWPQEAPDNVRLGLGDFNEWWPFGRVHRRLHRLLGHGPRRATFPARWPVLALDRIYVRPRAALRQLEVVGTPPADRASDHRPLLATIETGAD